MFDISSLAMKDTFEMNLKHPSTGEVLTDEKGQPVTLVIYTKASKVYRNAVNAMINRTNRLRKGKEMKAEEQREESINLRVAATAAVKNLSIGGKEITPDNIRELYENPAFSWINEQIDAESEDVDNFLKQ